MEPRASEESGTEQLCTYLCQYKCINTQKENDKHTLIWKGRINQTSEVSHALCLFCFINTEHEVLLAFEFCHERSFSKITATIYNNPGNKAAKKLSLNYKKDIQPEYFRPGGKKSHYVILILLLVGG